MKIASYFALVIAAGLLALQVLAAIEYTHDGSLYTRASMIAAMVTLAALPVFIEAARKAGFYGTAVALVIAFCAFLAYSLPATTGRTGEVKEAKVLAAGDAEALRNDIDAADRSHWQISAEKASECRDAPSPLPPAGWPKCRRLIGELEAINERLAKLKGEAAVTKNDRMGDMGSDLWAWALSPFGATPEVVRKVSIMGFAIGLDIAIWALVAFSVAGFGRTEETVSEFPTVSDTRQSSYPTLDTDSEIVLAALAGKSLTNDELARRMSCGKSEASKRAAVARSSGAIVSHRSGKYVYHSPAM